MNKEEFEILKQHVMSYDVEKIELYFGDNSTLIILGDELVTQSSMIIKMGTSRDLYIPISSITKFALYIRKV